MNNIYIMDVDLSDLYDNFITVENIMGDNLLRKIGTITLFGQAFSIPEHGRLIDADVLAKNFPELIKILEESPTVIPACKENEWLRWKEDETVD